VYLNGAVCVSRYRASNVWKTINTELEIIREGIVAKYTALSWEKLQLGESVSWQEFELGTS
jgi:hypothetical protein